MTKTIATQQNTTVEELALVRRTLDDLNPSTLTAHDWYVSGPITSGLREFQLADRLGCDALSLRHLHPELWAQEVKWANIRAMRDVARRLADSVSGCTVVDPSQVELRISQAAYDQLWAGLLTQTPITVFLSPGWAFSRGARAELAAAMTLPRDFVDHGEGQISPDRVREMIADADWMMHENGWNFATKIAG